jgi:hypothetical protein
MRAIPDILEETPEDAVELFSSSIEDNLSQMGINSIDESLASDLTDLYDVKDITKIGDRDLGARYFKLVQTHTYINYIASLLDIQASYALSRKEYEYSKVLVRSDGKSSDDRKAQALISALHKQWSEVYLVKQAEYKLTRSIVVGLEKAIDAFSREISRRRLSLTGEI